MTIEKLAEAYYAASTAIEPTHEYWGDLTNTARHAVMSRVLDYVAIARKGMGEESLYELRVGNNDLPAQARNFDRHLLIGLAKAWVAVYEDDDE